jgi:quercetin dioxygenase-like cupin family protein/uncharacterized OsmC-like protein
MRQHMIALLALATLLMMSLWLPGANVNSVLAQNATPTPAAEEETDTEDEDEGDEESEEDEDEDEESDEEELNLVTARVAADLVQPGRLVMSARGNHWIYDSVAPLNGPNEAVNPLDGLLGALISCGMFIYEAVAIENEIALDSISASATGELDPRGVSGAADVNPRIRALYVTMNVEGPTAEEAAAMAEAFSLRCPIYTTLGRAAPITVTNVVDGEEQEPFATEAIVHEGDEEEEIELQLARPTVKGKLVEFGRAMLSARGNHWIYDSVPPINGPNEEVNPLDALVGALPACGIMIYEAVTRDEGIPLHSISATVEADLDPRGVAGAPVDPRIRAFRVTMNVDGPTVEEAEMLADEYRARCPIYTTFERSAPIEITNNVVAEESAADLPFGPTLVMRADLEIEDALETLNIVQMMLAFAPGAWTPPHHHGGQTIVTTLDGEMVNRINEVETRFTAGEGWTEQPHMVHMAGNDTDEMAHVIVSFITPPGEALTTMVEGMVEGELPPGPTALHRGEMQVSDVPEAFTLVQIILDFAPGAWTPLHYHGGDTLVTVLEGEMIRSIDGEEETFGPGDSWIEPAGQVHSAGNDSDAPARVAVSIVLSHGEAVTTAVDAADAEE